MVVVAARRRASRMRTRGEGGVAEQEAVGERRRAASSASAALSLISCAPDIAVSDLARLRPAGEPPVGQLARVAGWHALEGARARPSRLPAGAAACGPPAPRPGEGRVAGLVVEDRQACRRRSRSMRSARAVSDTVRPSGVPQFEPALGLRVARGDAAALAQLLPPARPRRRRCAARRGRQKAARPGCAPAFSSAASAAAVEMRRGRVAPRPGPCRGVGRTPPWRACTRVP